MAVVSRSLRLIVVATAVLVLVRAQEFTPFSRFAERVAPDMRPRIEGQRVRIHGVVTMAPVELPGYIAMPVQDEEGRGVVLENPGRTFRPGDLIEADGTVSVRHGIPAIRPETIQRTGSTAPPAPQRFKPAEILDFHHLGRYVQVDGTVVYNGNNGGGEVIGLEADGAALMVFLPQPRAPEQPVLAQFQPGDRVRVTGMSSQYAPRPPHDRNFQIIVGDSLSVELISKGWPIAPKAILWLLAALLATTLIFWLRERTLATQRRMLRGIITLSEEVVAAPSAKEIAQKLHRDLPRLVEGGEADLFLFKAADDTLVRVVSESRPQPLTVPVDAPVGTLPGVIALCLRNRALLRIPDTRKSPILDPREPKLPASALFIPTFAQGELMGVLSVYSRRGIGHSEDVDAALQHLGNQIAASLHLQERQQMRDQLLRSEKMAATGQLISGLAKDLRAPLQTISRVARESGTNQHPPQGLAEIASEASHGLEMIDHLLSFSRMEPRNAVTLDIHALVSTLVDLRAEERQRKGIACENGLPVSPVWVRADRGQIEQVLITVLVHAEFAATHSPSKRFEVSSRIVGRKAVVAFEAERVGSTDSLPPPTPGDYFGLPVAQVIAQGHGGDLRVVRPRGEIRLELELPVHDEGGESPAVVPKAGATRVFTCLLVEPDIISQRKLIAMLAARGHRGIPANTAEDAADLVQRAQFDALFCASRLAGLTWVELYHRVRRRVCAFGLLCDTWDGEASQMLRSGEGRVLTRPVGERELDDFLGLVEVRLAASRS